VQSQSITAKDLKFVDEQEFNKVFTQTEKIGVILGGLIRSTENLSKK